MKKYVIICLIVLAFVTIVGTIYSFLDFCDTDDVKSGVLVFKYNGTEISDKLSPTELATFKEIFDGKLLQHDIPACGFNENIAVVFDGDRAFSFACDGCNGIYCRKEDRYISLSAEEHSKVMEILQKHGFYFPCV